MNDFRELAKTYRANGLTTIPVDSLKQPTINWTKYQTRVMNDEEIDKYFKNCYGIALLTGGKGKVECVDIDLKNDLSGDFEERLKAEVPREILEKLWVQKTVSGGYHWIYKTNIQEPNQKLANRETSVYEKHQTYMEAFNNKSSRDIALKIASNHKCAVVAETRGGTEKSGGYILIAPTKGYEKIYGKLNFLTDDERNTLIEICRSFNEYVEPHRNHKINKYKNYDINPFERYNEEGNALDVLVDNGWEIVHETAYSVRLKRPGSTSSNSSALYDKETNIFNCFSTSSVFEPNQGYTPVNVFLKLECDDDTQVCYDKLIEMGYGRE